MKPELDLRLIFHSIHNVMLAEELLQVGGVLIDMIPVPREISSDCGMCLAAGSCEIEKIRQLLAAGRFTSPVMLYQPTTTKSNGYQLIEQWDPENGS